MTGEDEVGGGRQHFEAERRQFGDQRFAFYGKALSGTPEQSLRWKRALAATNGALDQSVGHVYVERNFAADDKARVKQMVTNIIAAFSKRIIRFVDGHVISDEEVKKL